MVVDKPATARKVFASRGWQVTEEEVVVVTLADSPGALGRVAAKLGRAGVNIEYIYVGTAGSARKLNAYLGVSDVKAALKAGRAGARVVLVEQDHQWGGEAAWNGAAVDGWPAFGGIACD